jgi:thiamine biosynthesis lipoprotein
MMGTYVTIKIADADKPPAAKREAAEAAFGEIKRLEDLLSSFKADSVVSRINSAGTTEVLLDEDTFFVLERAKYFYEQSGGAFDVTVLPLLELWGFHGTHHRVPSDEEIKKAMEKIGCNKMILDRTKRSVRFVKPDMKIDLGGIGKGYAADKAVEILKRGGIKSAVVAVAGDIYCLGNKPDGRKWTIGIKDPRAKDKIIKDIELQDEAVSTSGGYERFFELNGKKYSHIMNPVTGRPVENNLLSATVISQESVASDALATAAMVLGEGKAEKLIESQKGAKVFIVRSK